MPFADKTQYFVHLRFNSTLQLSNGTSSDLQKLLKYFNGTAIVAFFFEFLYLDLEDLERLLPNNLTLYLEDLKLLVLAISVLKLVTSSLE